MKKLSFLMIAVVLLAACKELDPLEPGLLVPRTVDEDSSIPSIFVNNTQLHAETFGNPADPMLVILHGGPGSDYRYVLNCKAFANEGFFVVFFDQRGCGLSKRHDKSVYTIDVLLDDLTGVIEHFRSDPSQKVILLGQSWGAMLATAYINKYPDRITGAVLGEPGGFVWADIEAYTKRTRKFAVTSEALNDATYLDQFLTGRETDHAMLDYKRGLALASSISPENPTGETELPPFWRQGAVVNMAMQEIGESEKPDFTENLGTYNTEVLFLYSELNTAYGKDYAEHVSSAYPSVRLERIDDTGHTMITTASGWANYFPIALNYLNEIR